MALVEFGILSRNHRNISGYLLGEQSDALGISAAALSSFEHGKRKIPEGFAVKVADFFQLKGNERKELIESALLGERTLKLKVERKEEGILLDLLTVKLHDFSKCDLRKIIDELQ